ncbi:MAG TPA: tail fiber protein [Burkholderiaceae bacterium]
MKRLLAALLVSLGACGTAHAQATEPFIGQLMIFAGNFCPTGWLPTDGRLLEIETNVALFSILGTQYGGDGIRTFALPRTQPVFTATRAPLTECIAVFGVFPSRS